MVELSFVCGKLWSDILVEDDHVRQIIDTQFRKCTLLFRHLHDYGLIVFRVYYKHFNAGAHISPNLREVIFELIVRQVLWNEQC